MSERRQELIRQIRGSQPVADELIRRAVLEGDMVDAISVFMRHVMGMKCLPFHRALLQHQQDNRECLGLAPRGYGKSTALTIARSLVEILRDPNIRILIASKTALQAEIFLRGIKYHLESNQDLIRIFGQQQGSGKWTDREIVVAGRTQPYAESTITTVGAGGPVASRHYDLIIGDDLVDESNSRTDVQREKVATWYYKTLYPTVVDETSRVYLHGTRFHPLDLWGKIGKEDPDVEVKIVRAIESDGSTPWPEKFSRERLEQIRQKSGTAIFNSQYQNDTDMMRGAIFREEWIQWWEKPPVRDGIEWGRFDTWVGCDPAATKKDVALSGRKASTDWWTIAVCSRERLEDDDGYGAAFFFRYFWRGRVTKADYIARVREVAARFSPVAVGVESNAAQEYLAQDLERFVPVRRINRTQDKVSRAYGLQPFFENGQIHFPAGAALRAEDREDWRAVTEELVLFPDAEHDDAFDAIETAAMMSVQGNAAVYLV